MGRTGAYIVIDSILAQLKMENRLGVYDFLKRIRRQRNYLVQTEDQYSFIHDVLLAASQAGETDVPVTGFASKVKAMAAGDELLNQWRVRKKEEKKETKGRKNNQTFFLSATPPRLLPVNTQPSRSSLVFIFPVVELVLVGAARRLSGNERSQPRQKQRSRLRPNGVQ